MFIDIIWIRNVYVLLILGVIYLLTFSCFSSTRKISKAKVYSLLLVLAFQMQAGIALKFLERNNFSQDSVYMKHRVKYRAEAIYTLENPYLFNMSLDVYTPSFQDSSQICYQNAELLETVIPGKEFSLKGVRDEHKNEYYVISLNLSSYERVKLHQTYEITIYDMVVTENNLEEGSISHKKQELYGNYVNNVEKNREINHSELISLSHQIVDKKSSPLKKAETIFQWVVDHIEYDLEYQGGGALNTYRERKGACGDFSDLMITLLRIQHIPAREVHGFFLDVKRPLKGMEFEREEDTLWDHSWVEYYVPSLGWVSCDPVFGDNEPCYSSRVDCVHFRTFVDDISSWRPESEEGVIGFIVYTIEKYFHSLDSTLLLTVVQSDFQERLFGYSPSIYLVLYLACYLALGIVLYNIIKDARVYFCIKTVKYIK